MRNGDRKVVVLGTGPLVKALGTARPIIDVEARSRRNIMPQRQAEILLPELLLSRLKVHEVKIRPFEVVEGDVFHAIGIDIEPFGKREVAVLGTFKIVVRQRSLSQRTHGSMADAFLIKRVVDAESGEGGIERIDMHLVVVPRDRPRKVGQRTDRIVEK